MQEPRPDPPPSLPDLEPTGTVIVGMSGGVDSAVAALLLQRAGLPVQGLFMSNWEDDDDTYCTTAADFQDARRVCEVLGIALHRVSFAAEYRERVFALFLREYAAGRTPNPDVLCNREIKFGVCLDYMHRLGASRIATGHYARLLHSPAGTQLLKAADTAKDQSYFLHGVAPAALAKTLFPIGELRKAEVRQLAHAAGLPVYDKPDSTGICFIGERPFQEFLSRHLHTDPGPIENDAGLVVGEHRGLALYTLGQRSGLRLGGRAGAAAAPWYVAGKDVERNALIVVQHQDHPLLLSDAFDVEQMHWLQSPAGGRPVHCAVKTRYRQGDLDCTVHPAPAPGPGAEPHWRVTLSEPARAVTPGQYAVFYDGARCLGGGVISRAFNSRMAAAARGITYNSLFSVEGS
ncbi:MAG TPA: tRNA 2-thiouridine(34) synthase MnmA [Steroidobacteraceae bacterium]|nr:tRNA 2-thiouridine(34) synthase MnmA [Steroidobacteraceae bacterium]